jgi:hypothetical protein
LSQPEATPEVDSIQTRTMEQMGGTRLELVTSTMSTWRSNQLS